MIDPKMIKHIAHLSRLSLSETEVIEYSEQLSKALNYFEQISKINTAGVEPLVTPTEIEPVWRKDEVEIENNVEDMLKNAPQKTGNLFTVPPVV